jgi:NRPS condensation-like uncharacterized protein
MLQWSRLHPYNAVHVVKVAEAVSPARFEEKINSVLQAAHLGQVSIDEARGTYRIFPSPTRCTPRAIGESDEPLEALYREIERQLNEPFAFSNRFSPFRFFLLPSRGSTYLGIAYFHAVADAESIGQLLLEIAKACIVPNPDSTSWSALRPRSSLRAPLGNPWQSLIRSIASVRQFQRLRTSHRPPVCEPPDLRNEFCGIALGPESTAIALAKAKHCKVTLNDLCLAALLLAVAPLTRSRFPTSRSNLSAACVVNLRDSLRPGDRNQFGLCLGTFTVTHAVPEGISLAQLAQDVQTMTRRIKDQKLALGSALTFRASRFMLSRMPQNKQRNFYRKSYPVWGSITNRRVDDLCQASGLDAVTDYVRAVSAGPAMPFVISVTGIAGRLNLGISSKPNVIPPQQMAGVIERFVAFLTAPE